MIIEICDGCQAQGKFENIYTFLAARWMHDGCNRVTCPNCRNKEHASKDLWQHIATVPLNTPVLVYLEREILGLRIHSAIFRKNISTIAGFFHYDMPRPLYWMPMPDEPEGEKP